MKIICPACEVPFHAHVGYAERHGTFLCVTCRHAADPPRAPHVDLFARAARRMFAWTDPQPPPSAPVEVTGVAGEDVW